jgi:hypothetical protein
VINQNEILTNYASLIKEAADWEDVLKALGLDSLIGAGIGAGGAAITGGGIGSGILTGLTGVGVGVGAATGVLEAAGILAAVGAAAYTIYSVLQHTDDNLDDLVDRLDALDPNEKVKTQLDGFIAAFKDLQERKAFDPITYSTDSKIKAQQMAQQINVLQYFYDKLEELFKSWPQIKINLTDWGFDPDHAETAIAKTCGATRQQIAGIKNTIREEAEKAIKSPQANQRITMLNRDELMCRYADIMKNSGFLGVDWDGLVSDSLTLLGLLTPGVQLGVAYYLTTRTKSALNELYRAISTLDPIDDGAKTEQTKWKTNIQNFNGILSDNPPMQADAKSQAIWSAQRVQSTGPILSFLGELKRDFAAAQDRFRGLGKDTATAEIDKAIAAVQKALTDAKTKATADSQGMATQIKDKGTDILALTKEIAGLDAQLVSVYGQDKVVYTDAEKQMIDFVRQVAAHPDQLGDPAQLEQYAGALQSFKVVVQQALSKAKAKRSSLRLISKRALLKTPGGTFRMNLPGQQEQAKEDRAAWKNQNVGIIQHGINYMNKAFQTGAPPIEYDLVYGNETCTALLAFINAWKGPISDKLVDTLDDVGLSTEDLKDAKKLYANPQAFPAIANLFSAWVAEIKKGHQGQQETQGE